MSDTLKAALITFVGAAIIAPLVVRGLAWLAEKRSQLLVVLIWNEAGKASVLDERVRKLIMDTEAFKAIPFADDTKYKEIGLFRDFFSAQSYMHFKISNNSRKKLAHLTLHDTETSDLYKIDEGNVFEVEKGQPIDLGDLQPGRDVQLHLWSTWSVPPWNPDSKQRFKFSADELDRVVIKEPMQEFLRQRYVHRTVKLISIAIWVAIAALFVLAGIQWWFKAAV
jgi:hypothetical protein